MRIGIARGRRCEIADRMVRIGEERDEAVVVAVRHERERVSVRRPRWRLAAAPREERRFSRLRSVERRDPDAVVLHECDTIPVRRDRRFVAFAQQLGCAAAGCHGPHLHLRLIRTARWIGHEIAFCRPVRSVIASPHVGDRLAVVRKRQVGQLLAVVLGVAGDAPRGECRAVGYIDVPHAALIERPGDTGAGWRRNEVVGERKIEDLIERERPRRLRPNHGRCGEDCEQKLLHARIIMLSS